MFQKQTHATSREAPPECPRQSGRLAQSSLPLCLTSDHALSLIGDGFPAHSTPSVAARPSLCPTSKIIRPLSKRTGYKKHSLDNKIVFLGSPIFIILLFRLYCLASRALHFCRDFQRRFISPLSDGSVHEPRPTHDGPTHQVDGELGSSVHAHLHSFLRTYKQPTHFSNISKHH